MLTPKRPLLTAIALSMLLPDAVLAQARSSAGAAAPSPRLSAPTITRSPTASPSVSPGATTPAGPSTLLSPTPLSPTPLSSTPSAGLTPPGGVAATTTPTTAQPGASVPQLSPMSEPLPSQFGTAGGSSGGSSPDLALSPGASENGSPSQSKPSKPGGGGK